MLLNGNISPVVKCESASGISGCSDANTKNKSRHGCFHRAESCQWSRFPGAGALELFSYWFRTYLESHTKSVKLELELQPFAPERLIEIFTKDDGNSLGYNWLRGSQSGLL